MNRRVQKMLERHPPRPSGECLLWTGHLDACGYGKSGGDLAHRLIWESERGPIPQKLVVMHSCDNPSCVNIDHFSLGTQQDNIADMLAKGRGKTWRDKRGENNHKAKLTNDKVWAIRWGLLKHGLATTSEIAAAFGVSARLIDRIAIGETWQHITENWPSNMVTK